MKTIKYFLIALIFILIILISIDLSTGIWYWNKLNLKFDSNEFNNIATPILTMIATPIYALALYTTIRQNKITLSQNLKPFYEKEIDNLILKAKKTSLKMLKFLKKKKLMVRILSNILANVLLIFH